MKKNLNRKIILLFIALFSLASGNVSAQIKEGETLDKIIAIVGDEVIMLSDMEAQLMFLTQNNPKLNTKDPALREQVLNAMIDKKLVITKAIEDSVTVTDDEISQRWEFQLQQYLRYYGSEKRLEDIYGMSLSQIKYESKEIIKKELLAEKIQQQKFADVKVSPREVEEFYNLYKDSLAMSPDQVEVCHIVKYITPSDEQKKQLYELAKRVRDSIAGGGDFADFAKRYSDDPNTSLAGGDLGWFEKGKLIREYEKAAFELQSGQISQPVETPFGYHIIETIDKRKDSIRTRHILFKIGKTDIDKQRAIDSLLALKSRVESGENFETLAKIYSEDNESKGFGGYLGKLPLGKLPEDMKGLIDKLPLGGVSEPIQYTADENKLGYHILLKKAFIPAHMPTLTDDYKEIEQMALNYKQMQLYQEWLKELRKTLYWEKKI